MDIMRTDFILVKEHSFSFADLDDMQPYERQVNVALVLEYLEKKKQQFKQ